MYNARELLGKIVTLKTANGQELVGRLIGMNEDGSVFTINKPKFITVSVENNQQAVYMMPFYLTATAQDEHFNSASFLAITATMESTADEYLKLVQEEEPVESVEVEIDPEPDTADASVDAESVES
jgi:hypothetical protein